LRYFLDIPKKEIPCSLAANRAAGAARVYFLGDKKTINPKITFLGWVRFFILSPKNRSNQLILPYHLS
jgi:hypothetical protein